MSASGQSRWMRRTAEGVQGLQLAAVHHLGVQGRVGLEGAGVEGAVDGATASAACMDRGFGSSTMGRWWARHSFKAQQP